ncbi:MAG: tetratricopeptide repeat protein [Alphaproteobacteria bacterium]|nr:tetratricopeptide repeat protein [Alphaproteobacteria bacterium]
MAARTGLALLLLLFAGPAPAADSWDKMLCMAGGGVPSANVLHCTRALDGGLFETPKERARGLFKRGTAQIETGAYADAVADFNEAIRLRPEYGEAFHNRGVAKWRMGKLEGALADFDESIALGQVELWRAYKVRGDLYAEMGRLDEALADYERSLAIRPDWEFARRAMRRVKVRQQGN